MTAAEHRIADVTVGIPTRDDDPTVFARLLDAVAAEPLAAPALVVDMSSGTAIREAAEGRAPRIRYMPYPESTGVSDSRNRIMALAETRYVLLIDADAVPERGWATAMRAGFERADDVAVVGARCLPVWPGRVPPLFGTAPAFDLLGMFDLGPEPLAAPRIMGTSYALDRERIPDPPFPVELGRRPGGGLESGEEVALCEAVRDAGWSVRYEPAAIVRHHLRRERASWRWMLRRARAAGRESRAELRLEPLPRRLTLRDYTFLAAIAPSYFAGRLVG
jgi:GT2 family glycosyltransferase